MPTTVETDQRRKKPEKPPKNLDLLCSVKYKNNLPDIPFDPKFLPYPFDSQRFIQYNPTSLERNHKHELLTEADLGVPIDLILPETYVSSDPNATLHHIDEALLEEEVVQQPESKRARQHAKSVSWLRRTEYISTEFTRAHATGDGAETKCSSLHQALFLVKARASNRNVKRDRASQIAAIETTFEAAKKPITQHYSKKGVQAKEVLTLFPDFDLWKLPFAQVLFDSDPATLAKAEPTKLEEMSQAMIRGMMDENNEQFVAYFLPTLETMSKRKEDDKLGNIYQEDGEYEYKLTREYNWNVKNKASKGYEEMYFFVVRPGQGIFYNEIETRVRLSKRRGRTAKSAMNSKLVVKHREMTDDELYAQEARLNQLEPIILEEGEEEEGDWEEGGKTTSPSNAREDEEEESAEEGEGTEEGSSQEEEEEEENEEDEEKDEEEGSEPDDEFQQAFGLGDEDD